MGGNKTPTRHTPENEYVPQKWWLEECFPSERALFREHVCVFRGITLLLGMMFSTSTLYTSWCLGRLVSFAEPWKGDMFLDKDFCSFHPENWGRFPIWLLFCQMGWNHQQVVIKEKTNSSILALGKPIKTQKMNPYIVGRFASLIKCFHLWRLQQSMTPRVAYERRPWSGVHPTWTWGQPLPVVNEVVMGPR